MAVTGGASAALLDGGARLHLHHGPIDLIVRADPMKAGERRAAFGAARACFDGVLDGQWPNCRCCARN